MASHHSSVMLLLFSVPIIQPLNRSDKWNSTNIVEAKPSAQKMTPCYKLPAGTICRTRNNECNEVGGKLREEMIQHTALLHRRVVVAVVVVVVIVGGGVVTFYFHCYLTHDLQDVQRAMQLKVFSLPLPPSHVT